MKRLPNRFRHRFRVTQHLVVPETQDTKARALEKFRPCCILDFTFAVLSPINFHRKHRAQADEVDDVVTERMLSSKPEATHLPSLKRLPESPFSVCHALAQASLKLRGQDLLVGLAFHGYCSQ